MKGGLRPKGFTIVETMIVLAVTGALFLMVATIINGRQNKTQFEQSIRDVHAQIKQIIDEVGTGYFPANESYGCTAGSDGPTISELATSEQGTNDGCIFVGKVIQFKVDTNEPEQLNVYTLAGLQRNGTNEVSSIQEAKPKVINVGGSIITENLKFGLTTDKMYYNNNSANKTSAIALVKSLAQYKDGKISSSSQQLDVVPIKNTELGQSSAAVIAAINDKITDTSALNPADGVQICFASAGTDQSGLVTIGSNGRQLTTTLKIIGNRTCDI